MRNGREPRLRRRRSWRRVGRCAGAGGGPPESAWRQANEAVMEGAAPPPPPGPRSRGGGARRRRLARRSLRRCLRCMGRGRGRPHALEAETRRRAQCSGEPCRRLLPLQSASGATDRTEPHLLQRAGGLIDRPVVPWPRACGSAFDQCRDFFRLITGFLEVFPVASPKSARRSGRAGVGAAASIGDGFAQPNDIT